MRLNESLKGIKFEDRNFIGTISLRDENLTLPDGSKMALGVDDGRWVLLHQKLPPKGPIVFYEYNSLHKHILVDKKQGSRTDLLEMHTLIHYFLENADEEDVITAIPPKFNLI